MTSMPHLTHMQWNFRDELQATSTQAVNAGTPETTWYVYDGHGKRARKGTQRAAAAGVTPPPKSQRVCSAGGAIYPEEPRGAPPAPSVTTTPTGCTPPTP